jgi:hypothetical protein
MSYINISANLVTLRCVIQIDNPNYKIEFSHKILLNILLGYKKEVLSNQYNECTNTVNIFS